MTQFLLIRHARHMQLGVTLSGRTAGGGLTAAGKASAARMTAQLAYEPIAELRSSPVLRARETATILADTIQLPVIEDPAFDEIDFGAWTGAGYAALAGDAEWQYWNEHRAIARVPGGESMAEAVDRAMARLGEVSLQRPGAMVAIVTHCDIIRGVLTELLGRSLDRIHDLDVPPASVSRIEVAGGQGRVLTIGEGEA